MEIYTLENTGNKAKVHVQGSKRTLYSYDTKIAEFDTETKEMQVFLYYSSTTGRHINKFFESFGLKTMTKKELFKKYNLVK